jgi:hypothetical protein
MMAGPPSETPMVLPATAQAATQLRLAGWVLAISTVMALAGSLGGWLLVTAPTRHPLSEESGLLGAIAWLIVAGSAPAWLLARGRQTIAQTAGATALYSAPTGNDSLFGRSSTVERTLVIDGQRTRLIQFARFWQVPLGAVPVLAAAMLLWVTWPVAGTVVAGGMTAAVSGLILAFPVLILERHLAQERGWIDAARLALLVRFALVMLTVAVLATAAQALGLGDAYWGQRAVAVVMGLACAELLIRALVALLLPPPRPESAQILSLIHI